MKYLKLFATDNDKTTYEEGEDYTEPYISVVSNTDGVNYNRVFLLTDRVQYPYSNGKEKATVVYTRTFSSTNVGKLNSWCLPFDYTITDEDRQNFTFRYISEVADGVNINVEDFEGTVLLANTPYLIVPKKAGTFEFKAVSVKLNLDKPNDIIALLESTNSIYNFYLVYTPFNVPELGYYAISATGALARATVGSTFPAYRWYFKVVSKS